MFGLFVRLAFGGVALGIVMVSFVGLFLDRIHNKYVLEVNLTIVASYITFFLSENTDLHVSGILALVAFGLLMSYSGKTAITPESEHALHHVWAYIGFGAETIVFTLSGIILG